MRHLVFVYGTLRLGQRNDINLKTPQPLFMGMAKVKGQLYSRGWYPGIRLGGDQWVVGEVYDISPELLAQLDVSQARWSRFRLERARAARYSAARRDSSGIPRGTFAAAEKVILGRNTTKSLHGRIRIRPRTLFPFSTACRRALG